MSSQHITEEDIRLLKSAVEAKAGYVIRTPKDFDRLHQLLFDEQHAMVSTSTLKRIWGYVQSGSSPRPSSLAVLAQYAGYADWEAFVRAHHAGPAAEEGTKEATSAADTATVKPRRQPVRVAVGAVLLGAIVLLIAFGVRRYGQSAPAVAESQARPSGQRVLRKGQDVFHDIDEYLKLFNIQATDTIYYRPVPHLKEVYVWGPEYGNTVWHNEGDKQQLMPTITEYWIPQHGAQSEEFVQLVNEKLYYERLERDELRITFMRDIVDSLYVFLGIYRIDRNTSNVQKCVWRRVADDLDIGHLEQLPELRSK